MDPKTEPASSNPADTPRMCDIMSFLNELRKSGRRLYSAAVADQPRCHFAPLQQIYVVIEKHGVDGGIYVSDLAAAMHAPLPAASRNLRMLEQDGLIERTADPDDRRKTLVRITPAGEAARAQCERALTDAAYNVTARLGRERLHQLYLDSVALLDCVDAEADALAAAHPKDENPKGEPNP